MKYAAWILVALLIVLHQDIWFWTDSRLVLGIVPIGLFYHVCLSIAAGVVWWLVVTYAWPSELEVEPSSATDDKPEPSR